MFCFVLNGFRFLGSCIYHLCSRTALCFSFYDPKSDNYKIVRSIAKGAVYPTLLRTLIPTDFAMSVLLPTRFAWCSFRFLCVCVCYSPHRNRPSCRPRSSPSVGRSHTEPSCEASTGRTPFSKASFAQALRLLFLRCLASRERSGRSQSNRDRAVGHVCLC